MTTVDLNVDCFCHENSKDETILMIFQQCGGEEGGPKAPQIPQVCVFNATVPPQGDKMQTEL